MRQIDMDYWKRSLELHKQHTWKLSTTSTIVVDNTDDLSLAYTPGVWTVCTEIAKDKTLAKTYTMKWRTIAVISDGSAVLWLWNIGPEAALPVMEGKCILFQKFWKIDAIPLVIDTQDTEEIIKFVKQVAPTFGWINLEDIGAPRCFEIEERLKSELNIPVFHDDQHGTAIVVLAGIINALKITNKDKKTVKVVVNGVGAAGVATSKLLLDYGIQNIVMVDSSGTIYKWRDGMNPTKQMLSNITNTACVLDPEGEWCIKWWLDSAIKWTDIFIWVSAPWILTKDMVQSMNTDPIIFALANPIPEIWPEDAIEWWAAVVATGRSDLPNQVNNSLVFPWIFAWALKNKVPQITDEMKIQAAIALANVVWEPTPKKIIPGAFDEGVLEAVSQSIK